MIGRAAAIGLALTVFSLAPAMAQSEAPSPKHMTVVFENSQVRVIKVKIEAGDKTEQHELRDAVAVPLTDYDVKFTTADGVTKNGSRKTGEAFWVPASSRVVEVGDKPAESIIVELKSASPAK